MSSKTRIVVLHMKEIIYTGIFILFLIILGVLMFFMFGPGKNASVSADSEAVYTPGIYRSTVSLGGNSFDVEVTVDADRIRSIHLANLSETTEAMFPLVKPALEELAGQIYSGQPLNELKYASDQKYTSLLLINAIESAAKKAALE